MEVTTSTTEVVVMGPPAEEKLVTAPSSCWMSNVVGECFPVNAKSLGVNLR